MDDTIAACASAPGMGPRAVVRLSGPRALDVACGLFRGPNSVEARKRSWYSGSIHLAELQRSLPARMLVWPPPRSYTGQLMVEIHTIGSPPLVDVLMVEILRTGARAARPGEFTLRAFLHGRRDLSRAEAVQAVVSAGSRDELRSALTHLAGGVSQPLTQLRDDLLNLLADVEAGLDFIEEDITFVSQRDVLLRVTHALAHLTLLQRQLRQRAVSNQPPRVVLTGAPNAGKSSLFNALLGSESALVSPEPGTTRDYVSSVMTVGNTRIELIDTAGWQTPEDVIEQQAQILRRHVAHEADLLLVCVESGRLPTDFERSLIQRKEPGVLGIATKCDQGEPAEGLFATSAKSGLGIQLLRERLAQFVQSRPSSAFISSLTRCQHHVDAAIHALRRAHAASLHSEPPEILALEIRSALDEIGTITGAIYTEDLLDRIFSRFCIGK